MDQVTAHINEWKVLTKNGWIICTFIMIALENVHIFKIIKEKSHNRIVKLFIQYLRVIAAVINVIPIATLMLYDDIRKPNEYFPDYSKLWLAANAFIAPINLAYWFNYELSWRSLIVVCANMTAHFLIVHNIFIISTKS